MANLSKIVGQQITNIDITNKTVVVYTQGGQLTFQADPDDSDQIIVTADD